MFGQTPPGLSKHSYFLSKLWQRKGFSRGPKAVARVKIMQTEGARILSVGAGAHRIIRRRWSPGLLVTHFRFYLASRREVLTPTFCDVRRYLNSAASTDTYLLRWETVSQFSSFFDVSLRNNSKRWRHNSKRWRHNFKLCHENFKSFSVGKTTLSIPPCTGQTKFEIIFQSLAPVLLYVPTHVSLMYLQPDTVSGLFQA